MTLRSVPVVDRVTDAFFALDTDFRFTYLNDQAEALLERSRGELIGRVMWDEFPQTVETQFPKGFHRAMDEQVPVSFEIYHTHVETWFETRAYPSESGLTVFMRDITDRKERQTTLAQHAAVVEAINDGIFTLDPNRRIVTVNSALERYLGTDCADVVGEHVEVVPQQIGIDDEDAVEFGRAITDVDLGTADARHLQVPFTDAQGIDRMGEFRVVPVEDRTATVAVIIRDTTDRYEYERVAASLHEISRWLLESDDPDEICAIAVHAGSDLLDLPISGVWLLDSEQGYLDPVAGTAGAHDEFGGLPRFYQGEGLIWDVFESGDVRRFDDLQNTAGLANPDTPLRSEIIAPIGTHGVLMTGSFEANRFDETDVELISTLVENTRAALDRAERERVLRERTAELERQTDRLEGVATVLSNDLKTQLEAVGDAFEDNDDSEFQFPLSVDSVETTLDRAERLVDDVREFARNATAVRTRSRIRLEEALEQALDNSRLDSARVTLEQGAVLRADPERFVNLLETTFDDIESRSAGGVSVSVDLLGGDDVRPRGFVVEDDAAATPQSPHERLVDPTNDHNVMGGLGLALVRAIAEAHDWTFSIHTTERTRIEISDITTLEAQTQ